MKIVLKLVLRSVTSVSEAGIYKSKQENKKKKQNLNQERDQEKEKVFSFFLVAFLVERVFSFFFPCFLDRFLGRVLVFLFSLTFLFSFINSHL